jgi:8-oxo-dGTP diphosphatase
MKNKHFHVVAAVITFNGHILCMQKGETQYVYTSHHYEFPGGKVERGETEPDALQRELREEMNYEIQPIRHLLTIEHCYPDFGITLSAWLCTACSDIFYMKEHENFQWLVPSCITNLNWCAADLQIAIQISKEQH